MVEEETVEYDKDFIIKDNDEEVEAEKEEIKGTEVQSIYFHTYI